MGKINHRISGILLVGLCIAFFLTSALIVDGQLYPYNYPYSIPSNNPGAAYYADVAWSYGVYSWLNAPSNYQPDYYGHYPGYNNTQAALYYPDATKYYNGIYPAGNWSYGPYPSVLYYGDYLRRPFNASSDLSKFGKQAVYAQSGG